MSKTVLITGASSGIGFGLTQRFLEHGHTVIGTSRKGQIENISSDKLTTKRLDLSSQSSIVECVNWLKNSNIKLDFLINNAGIGPDLSFEKPELLSYQNTFLVNVEGTAFLTEKLIPQLNKDGRLINISSKMGSISLCQQFDSPAYRMSKAALNMYSKLLTNRLKDDARVAAIHPGWVRTNISENTRINGRLSIDESSKRIFKFINSDFDSGAFWDVEDQRMLEF